jgi:predicted negative regulator of RcsB-dependent stress response
LSAKKIKGSKKLFETTEEIITFSQRSADFARENPYWIIAAVGMVLLILGTIWGVNSYNQAKEKRARAEYAQVIEAWPASDFADFKEWNKLVDELEGHISKHQGTQSALNAQLNLAQAYFWMKRYDDSIRTGDRLLAATKPGNSLRPLVLYQLALAYEEAGRSDESLAQWEALTTEGMEGLDREIGWHLARLYAGKKEYSKAVEQYERALQASGGYPAAPMIEEELAMAKLKAEPASNDSQSSEKQDNKG